jgi:hypothetical protein
MNYKRKPGEGQVLLHLLAAVLALLPSVSAAQPLNGSIGAAVQYGSGWIDFPQPVDFAKGERLRLVIGGTAGKILVRMLAKGQARDSSDGLVGGPIEVPKTRVIELTLGEHRAEVIQISVHGGPNPWGKFPMPGNGPAALQSVEKLPPLRR